MFYLLELDIYAALSIYALMTIIFPQNTLKASLNISQVFAPYIQILIPFKNLLVSTGFLLWSIMVHLRLYWLIHTECFLLFLFYSVLLIHILLRKCTTNHVHPLRYARFCFVIQKLNTNDQFLQMIHVQLKQTSIWSSLNALFY